jgi:RIO kinase 2
MYMSRLAAIKEFSFMKALSGQGLPVPEAIAQNRHTIVMSLVDAFPLRQISSVPDPAGLYGELMDLILRLAKLGLIHGDFNEFNILIKEEEEQREEAVTGSGLATGGQESPQASHTKLIPIVIDFPQMVSIDHTNADFYFDRDVSCIKRFFERRFHFASDEAGPHFADAKAQLRQVGIKRLDVEVEASGFSKKMAKDLETYMKDVGVDGDRGDADEEEDGKGGGEEEEEEEDEEEKEKDKEEEEESRRPVDDYNPAKEDATATTGNAVPESLAISANNKLPVPS